MMPEELFELTRSTTEDLMGYARQYFASEDVFTHFCEREVPEAIRRRLVIAGLDPNNETDVKGYVLGLCDSLYLLSTQTMPFLASIRATLGVRLLDQHGEVSEKLEKELAAFRDQLDGL